MLPAICVCFHAHAWGWATGLHACQVAVVAQAVKLLLLLLLKGLTSKCSESHSGVTTASIPSYKARGQHSVRLGL
jgi:hypothetical protein